MAAWLLSTYTLLLAWLLVAALVAGQSPSIPSQAPTLPGPPPWPTALPSPPPNNWTVEVNETTCEQLVASPHYTRLLCPPSVVAGILARTYYDFPHCSPGNYTPGCMGGFFSPDPDQQSRPVAADPWSATQPQQPAEMGGFQVERCCPGHFCPEGVVCMIACSEGAFCPEANATSVGLCQPYGTLAKPYLGCGNAETHFPCPVRNYCPNTTAIYPCPSGHYCPSGSRCAQPSLSHPHNVDP
jgi:hypothetical protein